MRAFRIADYRFQELDGAGAKLTGGRWNSPGRPMIYGAETFAGAMLEILVHLNLSRFPKKYSYKEIFIPDTVSREKLDGNDLSGWEAEDQISSRRFGDRWLQECRSAILTVPSAVTHGVETNLLINPLHADFCSISASESSTVIWDGRFFGARQP